MIFYFIKTSKVFYACAQKNLQLKAAATTHLDFFGKMTNNSSIDLVHSVESLHYLVDGTVMDSVNSHLCNFRTSVLVKSVYSKPGY